MAWAVLSVAVVLAYSNSFLGPFIFDDIRSIPANPSIRSLWPLGPVLVPQSGGMTVAGRPILNLSFALSHAMGGNRPVVYHLGNLGIHLAAALLLYGFLRRTFLRPSLRSQFGPNAFGLALGISTLWALHPLQTEAVTYLVQRAESLAALFYLLTLYCFVRGLEGEHARVWLWLSVFACAIGMGCKETVASAPLLALLYDRSFAAGSVRNALRRRGLIYLTLASTWLLLAYFILATGDRGGTAGLFAQETSLGYFLLQCWAIPHYLWLVLWPHPLIFDYGIYVIQQPWQIVAPGALLILLGLAGLFAIWRRSIYGFLAAWFFLVLAPSSSFIPVTSQSVAEHRMYLPLAAVIAVAVLGSFQIAGRRVFWAFPLLAVIWGRATYLRNLDYQSEFAIWNQTATNLPSNFRARFNLGGIYLKQGRFQEAKAYFTDVLRLRPDYSEAHNNLGIILCNEGKVNEGMEHFYRAVKGDPTNVDALINVGVVLSHHGDPEKGRYFLEQALRLSPNNPLALRAMQALPTLPTMK